MFAYNNYILIRNPIRNWFEVLKISVDMFFHCECISPFLTEWVGVKCGIP